MNRIKEYWMVLQWIPSNGNIPQQLGDIQETREGAEKLAQILILSRKGVLTIQSFACLELPTGQ